MKTTWDKNFNTGLFCQLLKMDGTLEGFVFASLCRESWEQKRSARERVASDFFMVRCDFGSCRVPLQERHLW